MSTPARADRTNSSLSGACVVEPSTVVLGGCESTSTTSLSGSAGSLLATGMQRADGHNHRTGRVIMKRLLATHVRKTGARNPEAKISCTSTLLALQMRATPHMQTTPTDHFRRAGSRGRMAQQVFIATLHTHIPPFDMSTLQAKWYGSPSYSSNSVLLGMCTSECSA